MGSDDSTIDMIGGVYRRQYAGYVRGKRINSVSRDAEAWFWRVHAAVDDFGNTHGESALVYQDTAGRRAGSVTIEQVSSWLAEMAHEDLIRFYEVEGERYIHIVDFILKQPGGRNGRRVHKVSLSPWDETELSGQSLRGIPVNPGESRATITTTITTTNPDASASGSPATSRTKPAELTVDDISTVEFPLFPISAKKRSPNTWRLPDALISELATTYPAVDVPAECRRAWQWVKANIGRRKTAQGMPKYLNTWMSRQQDRGGSQARSTFSPASRVDEQRRRLEAVTGAGRSSAK